MLRDGTLHDVIGVHQAHTFIDLWGIENLKLAKPTPVSRLCARFNIQDDQSWAFSETVQKISKITYMASRFSLLTNAKFVVRAVWSGV